MTKTFEDLKRIARSNPEIKDFLDGETVDLAKVIFNRRMSLGLTQQQLADMSNVDVKMIYRIEGGSRGTNTIIIGKVLEALNVNLL